MSATKGTEIAALEARRNELQVLAEGGLLGERRASWARLAMVVMFGVISNLRDTPLAMTLVGAGYALYALGLVIALRRVTASPEKSRIAPLILSTVDFGFITTQGLIDYELTGHYDAGMSAIAAAIVMSFAIARGRSSHTALSAVLGPVSFAIVAIDAGQIDRHVSVFVLGGLVVLGFMILMTNVAVRTLFADLRRRDNLTRFLPRPVAERMLRLGPTALAPVEREVTVMFSDIRGFTEMSEKLSPKETLAMLDDYFGRMSQIVKGHDGVVGKFLGDGLLAFWGVPDRLEDHAQHAVRAARDMRKGVRELNQYRETQGLPPIRIGIGIHTGTVAAGMLGGALQAEYTVIGDAVNVASRIEGLTKQHGVDVLISETTFLQLAEPRRGDKLATAQIRGRKEPIDVYTIDASAATVEVSAG